jgi:protein-S-isoprenylcysteine O-methyltransferase Ste14
MPDFAYAVLACAWLVWILSFSLRRQRSGKAQQVNRRARWGIALEMIAFFLIWRGKFWERRLESWRFMLAVVLFAAASLLAWKAVSALGRQWRIDAGLNSDHQLVQSGPYAIVRHPIYTSMLCMLETPGAPWKVVTPA